MTSGRKIDRECGGGPVIVAVETSGRMGSVALAERAQVIGEKQFTATMRHSAELLEAISVLLEGAGMGASDISEVYVSAGPGSFTGLRIAVSFAKTMHLANGVRIVGVGTLDVIAANAADFERDTGVKAERIGAILDAKRGQFYVAAYEQNDKNLKREAPIRKKEEKKGKKVEENEANRQRKGLARVLPDAVMTPEQFLETLKPEEEPIWLLGEGLVYYKDKFTAEGVRFMPKEYWNPRASKVHMLGWGKAQRGEYEDAAMLTPSYLMRPDVRVKAR